MPKLAGSFLLADDDELEDDDEEPLLPASCCCLVWLEADEAAGCLLAEEEAPAAGFCSAGAGLLVDFVASGWLDVLAAGSLEANGGASERPFRVCSAARLLSRADLADGSLGLACGSAGGLALAVTWSACFGCFATPAAAASLASCVGTTAAACCDGCWSVLEAPIELDWTVVVITMTLHKAITMERIRIVEVCCLRPRAICVLGSFMISSLVIVIIWLLCVMVTTGLCWCLLFPSQRLDEGRERSLFRLVLWWRFESVVFDEGNASSWLFQK